MCSFLYIETINTSCTTKIAATTAIAAAIVSPAVALATTGVILAVSILFSSLRGEYLYTTNHILLIIYYVSRYVILCLNSCNAPLPCIPFLALEVKQKFPF